MGILDILHVAAARARPVRAQVAFIIGLGSVLAVASLVSCTETDPTKSETDGRMARSLGDDLDLIREALRGFIAQNPDVAGHFDLVLPDTPLSGATGRTASGHWMIGSWFVRGMPTECIAEHWRDLGFVGMTELVVTLQKRAGQYEVVDWEVTQYSV